MSQLITADRKAHVFPPMKSQGGTLTHQFLLTNRSRRSVKVKGVHTSCSCASARIDKYEIKSGEQAILSFSLDTAVILGHRVSKVLVQYEDNSMSAFSAEVDVKLDAIFIPTDFIFQKTPIEFDVYKEFPPQVDAAVEIRGVAEGQGIRLVNQSWELVKSSEASRRYHGHIVLEAQAGTGKAIQVEVKFSDGETVVKQIRFDDLK